MLQFDPGERIQSRIDTQRGRTALVARRGNLTDRRGRIMATTQAARRLFVDPLLIEDPTAFSEYVGYELGYNPAQLERTLFQRPNARYLVLDEQVNDARLKKLKTIKLAGLATETNLVRHYPMGNLAGQVIGFVGRDGIGLEGLERVFNPAMRPTPGAISYWRDAARRPIWVEPAQYRPPADGQGIRLSLDAVIQSIAQQHLKQAIEQFGAESGQMVVISPRTGEILAMANEPPFNPNDFASTKRELYRNRCVTDAFEPGSTFKPFVWAAATRAGIMTPGQLVDCTKSGVYRTDFGRRLHDSHPIGEVTWENVLIKSSNIGMAIAGQQLGIGPMYEAVSHFGFGEKPGSPLPGESPGLVQMPHNWTKYTLTSVPMGQEIAVTALQLARGFSAFANGGLLVQPTIRALDPQRPEDRVQIHRRAIDEQTANLTREVLHRVMTEGTGRKANLKTYAMFGKTGTAQMADPVNGGYLEDQYLSAFVCGAPLNDPQLVIATFIQKPDKAKGYYGGIVAAPASAAVMEKALRYLEGPGGPGGLPGTGDEGSSFAQKR